MKQTVSVIYQPNVFLFIYFLLLLTKKRFSIFKRENFNVTLTTGNQVKYFFQKDSQLSDLQRK